MGSKQEEGWREKSHVGVLRTSISISNDSRLKYVVQHITLQVELDPRQLDYILSNGSSIIIGLWEAHGTKDMTGLGQ